MKKECKNKRRGDGGRIKYKYRNQRKREEEVFHRVGWRERENERTMRAPENRRKGKK